MGDAKGQERRALRRKATTEASAPPWGELLPAAVAGFATALFLRLLYLLEYSRDQTYHLSILDQKYNDDLAQMIASGEGPPPIPFFRPPGYVYFLAFLRSIWPEGFTGIRVVQMAIGAAGCGIVALLAGRLFGKRAAWVAGLMAAAYGPAIVGDAELLSPVLILPLNACVLLCCVEGLRSRHLGWWLGAGFAGGISALVRPDVLPFLAAMAGAAFLYFGKGADAIRPAAALVSAAALVILPCFIRNWQAGGEPVLIATNGGVNFYIGNNPRADGQSVVLPEKTTWSGGWEDYREIARQETGRDLSYREASSYFFRKGLHSFAENPQHLFPLLAKKLYYFWHGLEVMNSRDDYMSRYYSFIARGTLWHYVLYFPFGILGPLAIGGAWWAWRGQDRRGRIVILYIVIYWLVVSAFFFSGRFRLPIIPAAVILVAGFVSTVWENWRAGNIRSSGLLPPLVMAAALIVPLNFPYRNIWEPGRPAVYLFALGTSLENQGYAEQAIPFLQRAIELDPDQGDAYLFLADAHRSLENYGEAEQLYRRLLERQGANASILTWLGEVLALQGRTEEARAALEQAIALNPVLFDAYMGLGVLLIQEGDTATARKHFEAANRIQNHPAVKLLLASLAFADGRLTEAEQFYREAIALDGSNSRAYMGMAETLAESGNIPGARQYLQRAVELGESSPRVAALQARLAAP